MNYCCSVSDGYIVGVLESEQHFPNEITEEEKENVYRLLSNRPTAPDGYTYKLRADDLEWELVELPPVEPETLTDEEALTRFSNTITGANDPDLISAAETLITDRIKED